MRSVSVGIQRGITTGWLASPIRVLLGFVVLMVVVATPAGAQSEDDVEPAPADPELLASAGFVQILEVSGLLDDVVADVIEDAIESVTADGGRALVLQVNSKQAVISDQRLNELAALISDSSVPVAIWVGPSGSRAAGRVAQLVAVASSLAVAPGATIGPTGDQVLDEDRFGVIFGDQRELLAETELTWEQAIDNDIVPCDRVEIDEAGVVLDDEAQKLRCAAPVLGDFLINLDEFDSRVIGEGVEARREPLTRVTFGGLSLLDQLMHTVASPPVAYLMLVIGLALILFEFFSIGIGIAGVIGAVFIAFGAYGLEVLPVRMWAVALLLLSMFAFAIDVQTAVPRAWTVIAMVFYTVGTIFLYPESDVNMSWIPMLVSVLGMAVVMFRGMPIMVRGRFSTTAIDRSFLIDQSGVVTGPDTVEIGGAQWPASVPSGTAVGDAIDVIDADDVVVGVTPKRW